MARVYLAEDLRHGRLVAIKVLRAELAAPLGSERFIREIRLAAQLTHPHILALHDSGEAGGLLYYVMPYVDGISLRERLERDKQLPVDEAVRLAAQVADALAYAHDRGVVHRDIKPENIMIEGRHALVADFGIARAFGQAGAERLTGTGYVIGTPGYLSPEQTTGEGEVDGRSDVYSLACVLFEALAGEPPYHGPTAQARLLRQLSGPVPSVRSLRESVPDTVDRALTRALSTIPADRYETAHDFAAALTRGSGPASATHRRRGRTVIAAVLALVAAAALAVAADIGGLRPDVAWFSRPPTNPAGSPDARPIIAVLPFVDMSPGGDQGYFSDGISEEILTVLSRVPELKVVARTSAFTYRDVGVDVRRVGEELGVPYLLSGSVRRAGDQLRISAELAGTTDGLRIWSQTYDRQLSDVFAIQTEIAEAIALALRVPLRLGALELVTPTVHMDAHELYLTARAAMRSRGSGVRRAIGLFEEALARDSAWAPVWAGIAEAHAMYPLYAAERGESTDSAVWATSLAAADQAARRALELDPRNASARVALGGSHRDRWEWASAERELQRALEIDPDNAEARLQYAEMLWGMGRLDESLRETTLALALDQAPIFYDVQGFVLYMNGRPAEGEAMLEEGLVRDPAGEVHYLRTVFAHLLLMDGRYRIGLERFGDYLPDTLAYRRMGEAIETGDGSALSGTAGTTRGLAQTWMLLDEPERALDVLEEATFRLPFRVQFEIWDPVLAPLWDTPRFRDVILPRVRLDGVQPRFEAS